MDFSIDLGVSDQCRSSGERSKVFFCNTIYSKVCYDRLYLIVGTIGKDGCTLYIINVPVTWVHGW